MAFEYGFYNSINSDRKYNAIQFGQIFDGVINDGVFLSIGEKFTTLAAGGMDVTVGTGKAWFNHTWSLNTTKIPFTLDGSHPVLSRYDAIILEINDSPDVYGRVNSIKVVKGEPSSNAIKPSLVNDQYIHQYPLSYVKINPGATNLTAADIEIVVGRDPCPYVTGILQTTDITELYNNWEGQFTTWFNNLKAQLTDNVVANLQAQIDACLKPADIATAAQIKAGTAGKLVDADGLKNNLTDMQYHVSDIVYTRQDMSRKYPGKWILADGALLYPDQYPQLRSLGWTTTEYVTRGQNIKSSFSAYWIHQDIQLIVECFIINLIFNQDNVTYIDIFDRISFSYVRHAFNTPGIYRNTCSGIGSCARYQDGKVMFVFWTGSGMWYVLECTTNISIWDKNNWVLFSTSSANANIPRKNMDTMFRYGNSLYVYEQGGDVIKIDLEYTYKSLIVANAGLVNKNINLGSGVGVERCPAELIIHNGAYYLPIVTSNNLVGLIRVAPETGLGIAHLLSASVHAGRDLVRCFVRAKTATVLEIAFVSSQNTNFSNINASNILAFSELWIEGGPASLTWRVGDDVSYNIVDIPSDYHRWVALAAHGIGGRSEGMVISCVNNNPALIVVYSEQYKTMFILRSLSKESVVNGTFIVRKGLPLDFHITWPGYAYTQDGYSFVAARPYNTIWLYGEVANEYAIATPYAIQESTKVGTLITYFPKYRLPSNGITASEDFGCYAFVKVAD